VAAGAVNSIAGGGTLLTFPALLAGLSPLGAAHAAVVANATSTVALVPGSLAGAWGYRREMKRARRWLYLLVGPSLAGGVIGALLVTRLSPAYFAALVPWLLLTAALPRQSAGSKPCFVCRLCTSLRPRGGGREEYGTYEPCLVSNG
jgi:uncharacterized membrane protein YfcA